MSDYTPTTNEVRKRYSRGYLTEHVQEFDRWLEEYTRKKQAQAWEEGALWHRANAVFDDRRMKVRFLRDLEVSNPYRQGEK